MNEGRQSIFKVKSNQVKKFDLFFSSKSSFDLLLVSLNTTRKEAAGYKVKLMKPE